MSDKVKNTIRDYLYVTLTALLSALAYYVFLLPNFVVPSGVTGIASILQYALGFPAEYGLLLLNIPLLIAAGIYLSKGFSLRTIYCTILTSVFMMLLELIDVPLFDADILVAVLFGGVLAGVSMIFSFFGGGSSGGTEILARIIVKKNPEAQAGRIMLYCNLVIMTVGGFFVSKDTVFDLWMVVYSLIYSFTSSFVLDKFSKGFDPAVKFSIVTQKPQEMCAALFGVTKSGISSVPLKNPDGTVGKYTMLVVVSPFRDSYRIKTIMHAVDSDCFAYTTDVDDVVTRPDFSIRKNIK